jgi:hypothetical protein
LVLALLVLAHTAPCAGASASPAGLAAAAPASPGAEDAGGGGGGTPGGAAGHGGHAGMSALFFFALSLLIGVATLHITAIPYTALLLVWGVLVGLSIETVGRAAPLLAAGTHLWENMEPTLLLAAFLPVLLFAGAFALEWHVVRRLLPSSLLLAGPGVAVGAGLTAVLVRFTFPHGWNWPECLLFGSMLSATDPVAVVAILREAGMSKRLRTLVDLEALLNDGVAYVLFVIVKQGVEGGRVGGGSVTLSFLRLAAGGVAAGLVAGLSSSASASPSSAASSRASASARPARPRAATRAQAAETGSRSRSSVGGGAGAGVNVEDDAAAARHALAAERRPRRASMLASMLGEVRAGHPR